MKALAFCESLLLETPLGRFLAILVAVAMLRSGVWAMPNLGDARLIALDPFGVPALPPLGAYVGLSRLGPTVAWALGATGPVAFWLLHAVCVVLFMAVVAAIALRHLPAGQARVALLLFAVLPVSTTALFWVGTDGLTLLLIGLALALPARPGAARRGPVAACAVGVLLGWQHAELAAIAFAALLLALVLDRWRGRETGRHGSGWVLAVLAGIVVGKLLLTAMLAMQSALPPIDRLDWMRAHLGALVGAWPRLPGAAALLRRREALVAVWLGIGGADAAGGTRGRPEPRAGDRDLSADRGELAVQPRGTRPAAPSSRRPAGAGLGGDAVALVLGRPAALVGDAV